MGKLSGKIGLEMEETRDANNYKWWLKAVESDDVSTVNDALCAADDSERNILLNGSFHYNHKLPDALRHHSSLARVNFQLTRPWCIAGVASAHNVMNFMLSQGVDAGQKDLKGYNVVHALIMTAFLDPTLEETMTATYVALQQVLSLDQLKALLEDSNDEGYKPIEYAGHLSVYLLLQEIFKTEGIYLFKEEVNSVYTIDWYKVTDYEKPDSKNRRKYSPIYMLMMVEDGRLTDDITNDVFAIPLVQNWTKFKMKTVFPTLICWFLVRVLFIVSFLMTDIPVSELIKHINDAPISPHKNEAPDITTPFYTENISIDVNSSTVTPTEANTCMASLSGAPFNQTVYTIFIFYLMIHALAVILYDILECFLLMNRAKFFRNPKGWKDCTINYWFYRLTQFFQAAMILTYQTSKIMDYSFGIRFSPLLVNFIYINITMSIIWSLLFFVQLMPWIGHFVLALVSMVMKLFQFMFIFCAFSFPFVGTFQRLMNSGKTIGECPPEFENFGYSFYTVFTVMLNMVDFRKFNPQDRASVFLLHAIYIFMTAILLINFLIALFSTSFLRIDDHKQVVQTAQRLSVIWLIEERMRRFCPCLYRWWFNKVFPKMGDSEYAVPCMVICEKTKSKLGSDACVRPQSAKRKRPLMAFMIK